MLALDIFNTFYGRNGYEGVGQAKAVMFFIFVAPDRADAAYVSPEAGRSKADEYQKIASRINIYYLFSYAFWQSYS